MNTIKTILGDEWTITDGKVTSSNTQRVYGYSKDMQAFLEDSKINPKMANRLRIIDLAPIAPTGEHFLIQDKENPGWSRSISFDEPQLNWGDLDYFHGEMLVNTADPKTVVMCYVSEPGESVDSWELLRFVPDDNNYGTVYATNTFDDAIDFMNSGNLPEALPFLNFTDSRIIDMPNDYTAEVIRESNNLIDGLYVFLDVHVMNKRGECVASINTRPNTLLEMRDNAIFFEQIIGEHPYKEKDHVLGSFRDSILSTPSTIEEFKETFESLKANAYLKFETADKQFELLVSWKPINSLRTVSGKRLFAGEEIPPLDLFKNWHEDKVVTGKERGYEIHAKNKNGAIVRSTSAIPLDTEKLFLLVTDASSLNTIMEFTEKRLHSIRDANSNGISALIKQEIIATSPQGTQNHVEYVSKKEISVKEMESRIKNQYRRAEDSFLKLG